MRVDGHDRDRDRDGLRLDQRAGGLEPTGRWTPYPLQGFASYAWPVADGGLIGVMYDDTPGAATTGRSATRLRCSVAASVGGSTESFASRRAS